MEEFEGVDVVGNRNDRTVELQCVIDNLLQRFCVNILTEECISNCVCNLLKRHLVDVVKELLWECFDVLWHVEAAILSQTLYNGLFERCYRCFLICTIIFHLV